MGELTLAGEPVVHADLIKEYGISGKDDERRFKATADHVAAWLAPHAVSGWDSERPVAYDVRTGLARYLGPNRSGRGYDSKTQWEIVGTMDAAEPGCVYDLKTGQQLTLDDPTHSDQMMFYALCVATIHNLSGCDVSYLFANEDGIREVRRRVSAKELEEFALRLRAMVEGIDSSVPRPGYHCVGMYCPAAAVCPATKAALVDIDAASASVPMTIDIISPEHAVSVRHRLKMVQAHTAHIEAKLKEYVKGLPTQALDLGNGLSYGIKTEQRESVDLAGGGFKVLVKHLGDKANEAVSLETSKTDIAKAAGGKKQAEAIFSDLRAAGAMRVSSYEKLTEFKKRS